MLWFTENTVPARRLRAIAAALLYYGARYVVDGALGLGPASTLMPFVYLQIGSATLVA